jgi:putative membrane protein
MKKLLIIAAAGALFAVPAAAQTSLKDKAKSAAETTGIASALGISPTTRDFVNKVAISDMFEIKSSELAKSKANNDSKAFADHMVTDHSKTSSELKAMVSEGKVKAQLPDKLDASHQAKLDKLQKLNGKDFDKQYDDMQRSAHKDAVSLFERYSKNGDHPELKAWAAKTLPALKQHLSMAQKLK